MVWLNIDKPTRRYIIHADNCVFEQMKTETPYKGIGRTKRDGGWLAFESYESAEGYYRQHFTHNESIIRRGWCCFPN